MQFEFQIEELEHKIEELKKFSEEKEVDLTEEINKLKDQRDIALKVLYEDLTDYQRVIVSMTSRKTVHFRLYRKYNNRFY